MTSICEGSKEIRIPKDTKDKIGYLKSKYNINDLRVSKDGTKFYEKCTTKTKKGYCSSHQKKQIDWKQLDLINEKNDDGDGPCIILSNQFLTALEKVLDNWTIEDIKELKDHRKSEDEESDILTDSDDNDDDDNDDEKIKMKEIRTVDGAAYNIDSDNKIYKIDTNENIGELCEVKYDKAPFCIDDKFYICSIDRRFNGAYHATCYLTNQVYGDGIKPIGLAHFSTRTREWVLKKKKF